MDGRKIVCCAWYMARVVCIMCASVFASVCGGIRAALCSVGIIRLGGESDQKCKMRYLRSD